MVVAITMPALSPTMTHGTLAKWSVKEGDKIESGKVVAEIETDKATMEVEAVDDGVLGKILFAEGTQDIAVNDVIAYILEEGDSQQDLPSSNIISNISAVQEQKATPSTLSVQNATPAVEKTNFNHQSSSTPNTSRVFITPLAKRIATLHGIAIETLTGSGPHGRIIKKDVEHYMAYHQKDDISSSSIIDSTTNLAKATYHDTPLSSMRKIIAERLTDSKKNIPHFYVKADVTIDSLLTMRQSLNEYAKDEYKISVNDMIMKCYAFALHKVSQANVTFHGDYIRQYDHVDMAMAVAIKDGLITPIVPNVHVLGLKQLSQTTKILAQKARDGKLQPHEYQGGSATISNLGMFGVDEFSAILNPPQCSILAVGQAKKKPVIASNGVDIHIATMTTITLSVDHRAIDGAVASMLLQHIKQTMESPERLLL